jgi:phosphoglycerate dehydrogenase-like enzyme
MSVATDLIASYSRRPPASGEPIRVVFGRPRFSPDLSWDAIRADWTGHLKSLAVRVMIEHTEHNELGPRLLRGFPPVHVVVPLTSPVTAPMMAGGSFGLIQQFGAGTDVIDLAAASRYGVLVANMPGLNSVPVAEHAMALLLALARRIPEARDGFRPGHWGEPAGRSLAGTTAVVIGLGAIGSGIARRLAAFDVTVTGVQRHVTPGNLPLVPGMRVFDQADLHAALAKADSVIIAASYSPGQPPLIDAAAISAMRPGALLVNVARGGLLDDQAALAALDSGHLGGLGLDVYPQEPYPADGPLVCHPRVVVTAHTAALTHDFFRHGAKRLGEALYNWVNGNQVDNLVVRLTRLPVTIASHNAGATGQVGSRRLSGPGIQERCRTALPWPAWRGRAPGPCPPVQGSRAQLCQRRRFAHRAVDIARQGQCAASVVARVGEVAI